MTYQGCRPGTGLGSHYNDKKLIDIQAPTSVNKSFLDGFNSVILSASGVDEWSPRGYKLMSPVFLVQVIIK